MDLIGKNGRKDIDIATFEELCKIQCTADEICGALRVNKDTLATRVEEHYAEPFSAVFAKLKEGGKMSVRRLCWQRAQKSDKILALVAKNYIGLTEKQEIKQESTHTLSIEEFIAKGEEANE